MLEQNDKDIKVPKVRNFLKFKNDKLKKLLTDIFSFIINKAFVT